MITNHAGSVFNSTAPIICHQANCQSIMGAGIAKQVRAKFPEAYATDRLDPRTPAEKFGSYSRSERIVNLYGQLNLGRGESSLPRLAHALKAFFEDYPTERHIAVPHGIGCGLGGGNWPETLAMLERAAIKFGCHIEVWKF